MVKREVGFYNLDAIISVGFRVNTIRGIQFRQWANRILKDYMLRGYAVNQRIERLEHDTVYHIGASIKDLGKKLFAFSKMEMKKEVILLANCK